MLKQLEMLHGLANFFRASLLAGLCAVLFSCNNSSPSNQDVSNPSAADTTPVNNLQGITQMILRDSLNPQLYFRRAQMQRENESYMDAATDMFLALSLDSTNQEYWLFTAQLFRDGGQPDRAFLSLEKAIAIDSANINYYVAAAKYAFIDSNYQLALVYLNSGLRKDLYNPELYFYKGMVYKEAGDKKKAISSFQTAVEQDPKFYDAYVQLGLLTEDNPKLSKQYLDNALKAKPNGEDALYAKGYREQELKQFEASIQTFRELVELNPQNEKALYALGYSFLMLDSIPESYHFFDLATKVNPVYAEAYYKKGVCAEQLNRKAEAMALYQNCLNIKPGYPLAQKALQRLQGQ